MKRHAARYAQGFAGTLAALVAAVMVSNYRQSRELDKALDKMQHRLELIQAEARGAMRARDELRRTRPRIGPRHVHVSLPDLAGRAGWKW